MAQPTIHRRHPVRTDRLLAPGDRGSALVLVPTLMLVLIALGGIAIDLSLVHGAHRAAHRAVSSAADDAASMIDTRLLQRTGEVRIDPDAARRAATAELAAAAMPGHLSGTPSVVVDPVGTTVVVTIELDVDRVMLRALPGQPDHERIRVSATARLDR